MAAQSQRESNHERRRSQIVDVVRAQGRARIDDLASYFGVSTMTIHRDLDHLHAQGSVRKVRSGAEAPPNDAFEHDIELRKSLNLAEKQAVGAATFAGCRASHVVSVKPPSCPSSRQASCN